MLSEERIENTVRDLIATHGESHAERIRLGVRQVAARWWGEDGDAETFDLFCKENFLADEASRKVVFERLQTALEQIDGHLHEVRREILTPLDLDTGPIGPVDRLLSGVDLASHVDEDLFKSRVAFLALLNFPVHDLADRLAHGDEWSRETWARSRMMDRFARRVPAVVSLEITRAFTAADQYIAAYNIRMDRLVTADGGRPFAEGLRLIAHWGLRDELKSQYAESDGLQRQRMILQVMNRIVRQEIPQSVIDNADVLWDPFSGKVAPFEPGGAAPAGDREPDTRYERLLGVYHAVRQADPFSPTAPSYIDRRFNEARQIPEAQVVALLTEVLSSDEFKETARLIRQRLGRPLEPFDLWYDGFKARGEHGEAELDRRVAKRYPDVAAFQSDLPRILTGLGFTTERAAWLSDRITVDPSRGAGHAMGALRRQDDAHLRTRVGEGGMDYKGYNIAVHELGHNVEQVFSLNAIDYWWLNGVPSNAFTEAGSGIHGCELAPAGRAGHAVGHGRDRRHLAGGHRGLALDVRAPGGDPGRASNGYARDRAGDLEPVLRRGVRRARSGTSGDLLAHDRLWPLPARLSDRTHHRATGCGEDAVGRFRRRVRAHVATGTAHAGRLDATGRR